MTILLCLDRIDARVLWRPQDVSMTKGLQDVVFLVKYIAPCDIYHQIFKIEPLSLKANVTHKFER